MSRKHIVLTSHPPRRGERRRVQWGAADPRDRGPIVGSLTSQRNVIGTHHGAYTVYRALAIASATLSPEHRPDLTDTAPTTSIGPHPQWSDPERIVSLDPFGAVVSDVFAEEFAQGWDIRPTIAVTQAQLNVPELREAMAAGRIKPDGRVLRPTGDVIVTKAAIEPVWHLPGIAARCGVAESALRRTLFEQTGGMFPELVTRRDLKVFLPPIGGATAYIIGDPAAITDPARPLAVRVHDECNGSDVFGSDICTCRPYLIHGLEVCVQTAQRGGAGVLAYFRKEGRALGEVTKFLVYNARKRGGDNADGYFTRTECVAGVQDVRFQQLMPDVLHWLGITRIDRFISMSNLKYDAVVSSGITIDERVSIPDELVPADARVEITAKKAAGYYTDAPVSTEELGDVRGRDLVESS